MGHYRKTADKCRGDVQPHSIRQPYVAFRARAKYQWQKGKTLTLATFQAVVELEILTLKLDMGHDARVLEAHYWRGNRICFL